MSMDDYEPEVSCYHYCRGHDGRLIDVDVARQNGRIVPRFPLSITEPALPQDDEESEEYQELVEEVCQNLNEVERRTWLRILDGRSILDIAQEEHVSRPAVYDRVRRMVRKNDYCAIWWQLRQATGRGAR